MWVPEFLYERLPAIYLVAAAICLWLAPTSTAVQVSAALLAGAAGLTFVRRRRARAEEPVVQARRAGRL